MKFTERFVHTPKKQPPLTSWWADPQAQADREQFNAIARAEEPRLVGNQRFGGAKRPIDKFPHAKKKSLR